MSSDLTHTLHYNISPAGERIMSTITSSVRALIAKGPNRYEIGRKRVTLALGGVYVASTTLSAKPLLVWETEKPYARYYIPVEAFNDSVRSAWKGSGGDAKANVPVSVTEIESIQEGDTQAAIEEITVGNKSTTWARFASGTFKDHIRIERGDFDAVFENGALSPAIKNPYKRIDTHAVSPHIVVKIDGHVVAETNVAVLLNETYLPEMYYIPATSIKDWGTVEKSDLRTVCPYKGEAW
jgi:uncharacterized protein (DUF427 family)